MFTTLAVGAIVLAGGLFFGLFGRGERVRILNEFGTVSIPKALDSGRPNETAAFAIFPFQRASNSILHMGSNTPYVEMMALAIWKPGVQVEAHQSARDAILYRTEAKETSWRNEAGTEIGEAIQHVNTRDFPVWMVVRDAPEKGVTVAYMVWKSESSLASARATADAVLASVKSAMPADAYLAKAVDRPGLQRQARLDTLTAALSAHGVSLAQDLGPVEHDGVTYELYTHTRWGRVFAFYYPIGDLTPADDYRWVNGNAPAPYYQWQGVVWFVKKDGKWVADGKDTRELVSHAAKEKLTAKPGQAFAQAVAFIDDLDQPEINLDRELKLAALMAETHRAGKLLIRAKDLFAQPK